MEQSKLQTTVPAKPPYPWRVPIIYALLGGPLGAWLLACYYLWLQSGWLAQASLAEVFGAIWGLVLWGYVFGGIPALLTGLLSMRLRLHRTAKGVACVVVMGAVLSLLWFVVINWDVSTLYSSPQTLLMKMPVIMSCGAASSLILSAFLPKPQLQ